MLKSALIQAALVGSFSQTASSAFSSEFPAQTAAPAFLSGFPNWEFDEESSVEAPGVVEALSFEAPSPRDNERELWGAESLMDQEVAPWNLTMYFEDLCGKYKLEHNESDAKVNGTCMDYWDEDEGQYYYMVDELYIAVLNKAQAQYQYVHYEGAGTCDKIDTYEWATVESGKVRYDWMDRRGNVMTKWTTRREFYPFNRDVLRFYKGLCGCGFIMPEDQGFVVGKTCWLMNKPGKKSMDKNEDMSCDMEFMEGFRKMKNLMYADGTYLAMSEPWNKGRENRMMDAERAMTMPLEFLFAKVDNSECYYR